MHSLLLLLTFGIQGYCLAQFPQYLGAEAVALRLQGTILPNGTDGGGSPEYHAVFQNDFGLKEFNRVGLHIRGRHNQLGYLVHGGMERGQNLQLMALLGTGIMDRLAVHAGWALGGRRPEMDPQHEIRLGAHYSGTPNWFIGQEQRFIKGEHFSFAQSKMRLYAGRQITGSLRLLGEVTLGRNHAALSASLRFDTAPWTFAISSGIEPARIGVFIARQTGKFRLLAGSSHHQQLGASPIAGFYYQRS